MAAGRHGEYYENEFRENEADFAVLKREVPYSKGEFERLRNGNNRDYNWGRNGPSCDRIRIRQKDVKEPELVNGVTSKSDSGGSRGDGGSRHHKDTDRIRDREPGELSSDSGSDEAIRLKIHGRDDKGYKTEDANGSNSPNKKRKFSPIVWYRDDKEVSNVNISKSRLSSPANTTIIRSPVPKSYRHAPNSIPETIIQISTLESNRVQTAKSQDNTPLDIGTHDSFGFEPSGEKEHVGLSSLHVQEERLVYIPNARQQVDKDYAPVHNIRSSRWANDANSLADDGELSDALRSSGIQRRRKNQSSSPEIWELHREGLEGTRARSRNENGYNVRSSSRDYSENDLEKDYMDIDADEDHSDDGFNVGQSHTDSESDDGSRGTTQPAGPPQRSVNMLQGCRSVDEFDRLNKIDEGTYGVVYRAKDKNTGEVVALKKVKMEKEREGFPLTSLREINILLSFHHPSVVDVKEVVVGSNLDSIFMVMEYMEHDLKALMETMKQPFSQSEVKCLMLQLLEGTKYLHDNWVLHRDLKTSNLLLNNRGELKICDFGLSRQYGSPLKPYTHLVVTLWYRAPELLLGAKQYSTAIDMWSLGCIMAELLSKHPLFNGKTEFDQLDKIFKTLGTPNETIWPGFSKLPGVKVNFVKHQYNLLRRKFPATSFTGSPVLSDAGFDLLNKLLTYNPEKRITAEAALNHEWFCEVPLPKSKDFMPTFPAQHAQDRRLRRVVKSPDPLEEQRRKELQQAKLGTGILHDLGGEMFLLLLPGMMHSRLTSQWPCLLGKISIRYRLCNILVNWSIVKKFIKSRF